MKFTNYQILKVGVIMKRGAETLTPYTLFFDNAIAIK